MGENVIKYDDELSYEIFNDGYDIYNVAVPDHAWITQREPYAKLFVPNGTYEENALAQLETLTHKEDSNGQ